MCLVANQSPGQTDAGAKPAPAATYSKTPIAEFADDRFLFTFSARSVECKHEYESGSNRRSSLNRGMVYSACDAHNVADGRCNSSSRNQLPGNVAAA